MSCCVLFACQQQTRFECLNVYSLVFMLMPFFHLQAEVHLLVSNEEAPDIYAMTEEDSIEVGPFVGAGLDLRSSGLLAIFR